MCTPPGYLPSPSGSWGSSQGPSCQTPTGQQMALISELVIPRVDCVSDGSPILQMRTLRPSETKFMILQPGLPGSPPVGNLHCWGPWGFRALEVPSGPARRLLCKLSPGNTRVPGPPHHTHPSRRGEGGSLSLLPGPPTAAAGLGRGWRGLASVRGALKAHPACGSRTLTSCPVDQCAVHPRAPRDPSV